MPGHFVIAAPIDLQALGSSISSWLHARNVRVVPTSYSAVQLVTDEGVAAWRLFFQRVTDRDAIESACRELGYQILGLRDCGHEKGEFFANQQAYQHWQSGDKKAVLIR